MSFLSTLRDSPAPAAAVEIAADRVSAASLEWRAGQPVVATHATEPLPAGALVPALTAANIHDRPRVLEPLTRVLERVGRPRRVGLVVPDVVAKVSLVKFETVPTKAQELDQLIRWQVRKTAPFAIEEAQVSYVPALRADDGQEYVVSLARRSVVQEYEALCAEAGTHAGIVDLCTFNVVNAVLAGSNGPGAAGADWLLVNIAVDYTSIALLRGKNLIFFRNRAADTEGTLADLVHQTAMYYEDRLKGAGFARVILAGAGAVPSDLAIDVDGARRSLEERLRTPVETVDPRAAAALTDRIAAAPALLDTLAPLVGLLLRDRDRVPA
ncbi:MAG TPA: pilus assembly protein PilM [Vicinamibacterales bacterium]|nr:pilus assembly protein PilM [Vicinamibacterales bacterium]